MTKIKLALNFTLLILTSVLLVACTAYGETWSSNASAKKDGSETTATPTVTEVFYIYTDSLLVNGGQGPRATSTTACQTMQTTNYAALTCTNHLAVLSFSTDDLANAVANHSVPTGRALKSTTSIEVATNYTAFLTNTLTNDLQTAGVATTTPTPFYWTSSSSGGAYNGTFNCTNNADGSAGANGSQGAITSTTAGAHLSFATNQPCDGSTNSAYLMCLCWN